MDHFSSHGSHWRRLLFFKLWVLFYYVLFRCKTYKAEKLMMYVQRFGICREWQGRGGVGGRGGVKLVHILLCFSSGKRTILVFVHFERNFAIY